MSDLIAFLENAGRSGQSLAQCTLSATEAGAIEAVRRGTDPQALARAFGDTRTMWCMVLKDDPEREGDEEPKRDDAPDRESEPQPDDKAS
jgi:hypothetical protein